MRTSSPSEVPGTLRMADWARLRTEFIWVYEDAIAVPYREAREHLPGSSALLLLEGKVSVEAGHGEVNAAKGQWVFPCEGPRLQRFSPEARVLSLHFHLRWPGGESLFKWPTAIVSDAMAHPGLERHARRMLRIAQSRFPGAGAGMFWSHANIHTHFLLHHAFSAWLDAYIGVILEAGILPTRLNQIDPRIERAIQTMDDLPLDARFDKAWLAQLVGLSPSQLDRLFTRQLSVTPRQYFENRKLNHARELLNHTSLSIKQVAYEVGFRSLPFFSRWFREHTGRSPRQFLQS